MEAGTGIEPVFTDLQSLPLARVFNGLGSAAYQDKACTSREPDTLTDGSENESPQDRAGTTGDCQITESFKTQEYLKRALAAIALCDAIADCERDDAVLLLEAALISLRAGTPGPTFAFVMQEANEWAAFATKAERKAYALASFSHMSAADRAAFLRYVTRGAA